MGFDRDIHEYITKIQLEKPRLHSVKKFVKVNRVTVQTIKES